MLPNQKAGDVLLEMGYKKVLNGGGFDSLRVRVIWVRDLSEAILR